MYGNVLELFCSNVLLDEQKGMACQQCFEEWAACTASMLRAAPGKQLCQVFNS